MIPTPRWRVISSGFAILAVTIAGSPGRATTGSPGLTGEAVAPLALTFVANMGVLVCAGETKVLLGGTMPGPERSFGQAPPGAEPEKFWPGVLDVDRCPQGQLAFAPNGSGVFWSVILRPGPEQTIYYSTFDGKAFSKPVVAPFAAAKGNGGPPMLTGKGICLGQPDGSWGMPVRLGGAVNTPAFERFPSLSRDGRFLFFIRSSSPQFVSDQAYFYWIDARILDGVEPGAVI